jgi:hypothetical protein
MEVHHPHHPAHKKKWNEYLLEFFMLFFAVTLGFLAENLRDQYIEKERAHELIIQLKTDIKNNIHSIDSVINRDKSLIQKFDSAMVYLVSSPKIDADSLFYNLPPNIYRYLSKNDTYDQMRSSGSLRYIKDVSLLQLILNYASDCQAAEARSSLMEGDFVSGEYTNVMDTWMPKTIAVKRFLRDRKGSSGIISKESSSQALITPDIIHFMKPLESYIETKSYSIEYNDKLKASVMPVIARRSALLMNTVRFMGLAKQSGEALLHYLEKEER